MFKSRYFELRSKLIVISNPEEKKDLVLIGVAVKAD